VPDDVVPRVLWRTLSGRPLGGLRQSGSPAV
jgi:hypothetical protein